MSEEDGDSRNQIHRYIRLNNLVPKLSQSPPATDIHGDAAVVSAGHAPDGDRPDSDRDDDPPDGASAAELKYLKLKPLGAKGYVRFHKLGEGYTPEEIAGRIAQNYYRSLPFPKAVRAAGNSARRQAHQAVAHRKAKGLIRAVSLLLL